MRGRDATDLLLLAALWGGSFLFLRVASPQFGPFALVALRTGIGAALLLPFVIMAGSAGELWRHTRGITIVGLLNSALPFVLLSYATLSLSAGFTSILNATTPFWGALIVFVWFGERLGVWRTLGLLVGFGGVLALVWGRISFGTGGSGLPILAALLATLSYGLSAAYTRRRLAEVSALTNAAGSLLSATLILLPFAWWFWPQQMPDAVAWGSVVLLGVLCSGLAYVLFFRLIARIGSTGAITVTFLIPVFGMLWGTLFLGESISANMIAGAAIILVGTVLTTGLVDPGRRA